MLIIKGMGITEAFKAHLLHRKKFYKNLRISTLATTLQHGVSQGRVTGVLLCNVHVPDVTHSEDTATTNTATTQEIITRVSAKNQLIINLIEVL